jgi:hypothetical protein
MKTIIEAKLFERQWPRLWTEEEHDEFIEWIAGNPDAGDVISGSEGCRKVRWARRGQGKSSGVRIIYMKYDDYGNLILITLYAKSERENISNKEVERIKNGR